VGRAIVGTGVASQPSGFTRSRSTTIERPESRVAATQWMSFVSRESP
jgi:hypothetical protein